jgi:hypothetical protein
VVVAANNGAEQLVISGDRTEARGARVVRHPV